MNQLDVKLEPDHRESASGKLHLKVLLTIDGNIPLHILDDDFDIVELLKIVKKSGVYFPWTCSCGNQGCAGYYEGVHVNIEDDVTLWVDKDLKKYYKFNTQELKAKIQAVYEDIMKWNIYADNIKAELTVLPSWPIKYLLTAIE